MGYVSKAPEAHLVERLLGTEKVVSSTLTWGSASKGRLNRGAVIGRPHYVERDRW